MSKSKETMTKKQQDDLASTLHNLPWGLPLGFPSMPPFGSFPPLGLPSTNFSSLSNFPSSATMPGFPPVSLPAPMSSDANNSTAPMDLWSNALSGANTGGVDYQEYVKQLGFLMNVFNEQQSPQKELSKASPTMKSSKSKRVSTPTKSISSSDPTTGKVSTSKSNEEPRPTSALSSSHRSSSRSKSHQNSTSTSSSNKPSTSNDRALLDPVSLAAANSSLAFPYFLPPLLSQTSSTTTTTSAAANNHSSSINYPFSNLSSSLLNPAATLFPFLSPDWFAASSSKSIDGFANLASLKPTASNESTSSPSKQSHKSTVPENKSSASKSKKRSKSIRLLTEEQDVSREKTLANSQIHKSASNNPSLLHSALTDSTHASSSREKPLHRSRRNSLNGSSSHRQTALATSADESRSNDEDDSDLNPKRRKTEEVNEALVRLPLSTGWKRVTIVRAITRTGVRGDVFYYAPCGRKLRSFQEIDRYLTKKNLTNLDRSNFTFSSKVHIGHFHEPKEGSDGKTLFQESNEDEIVNRILAMNPNFRRIRADYENEPSAKTSSTSNPSATASHHNGTHEFQSSHLYEDKRKLASEHDELSKRSADSKKKREAGRSSRNGTSDTMKATEFLHNAQHQHDHFLKAIFEQQKLAQQQEFEHQQKLQHEHKEQERKRQELAYLKQLEMKKRHDEKLLLLEQRKAEKDAQREKKIQEKYTEIVLAKESKRIAEDMQLRDLKPLLVLTTVDNKRLSIEAFANALMIIEFLNNFKETLQLTDRLIPTLNSFQQLNSRDINSLCQILLRLALDDPGIPNPKKPLTALGQKLSEIDITEHTFSEILRLYIRERNGFDEKITQSLSDTLFQSLAMDDKIEILAFLCNDLSTSKRIVEETDRHLDEMISLKHEKLEMEKRLRRLKFDKANQTNGHNVKKLATLIRDKDLNSSDNESPDESETELMSYESSAAMQADEPEIESVDETKIEDLDQRLSLLRRKYTLMKRRLVAKQSRARALHLGQDRYRRRYWYFPRLPGIYVEGLRTGDISLNDIKETIENAAKQRMEKKLDSMNGETSLPSRPTARKRQQTKVINATAPFVTPSSIDEPSTPTDVIKAKDEPTETDDEKLTLSDTSKMETLSTMDLSAFCLTVKQENDEQIDEQKASEADLDQVDDVKTELLDENKSDHLPLDLSCSKSKRLCHDEYWTSQHAEAATLLPTPANKVDQSYEQNGPATTIPWNHMKPENILAKNTLDVKNTNSLKPDVSNNYSKQIEQTIREKFQYPQPLPIPDDVQYGWWTLQKPEELRSLIKSLSRRGLRERYLCRMLHRYFDIIVSSMNDPSVSMEKAEQSFESVETDADAASDDQETSSSNDGPEQDPSQPDDHHEMDVLNEIYNLSDRIVASSLHCRSFDVHVSRRRLILADIQTKGSDVLDEAKYLLIDIERNIERRYLKQPFVRKYELNGSSSTRLHLAGSNQPPLDSSSSDTAPPPTPKYDEVPQQLERWRRTVNESRTSAQLALCLTQLERCIAWERSVMRVYCEICNSDADEEKLLLCDGCDHGTHTYCFRPPLTFIPPNDWYCYMCIGKTKGESLCFVCGNKGEQRLNRCEQCAKLFHNECLKNAKQQQNGKWLCVLCAESHESVSPSNGASSTNTITKPSIGRQTARSSSARQSPTNASISQTNGDSLTPPPSNNNHRSRSNTKNRKSKVIQREASLSEELPSDSTDAAPIQSVNDSSLLPSDDETTSSTVSGTTQSNRKKKSTRLSKTPNDTQACRIILDALLKSEASWPFQKAVDPKEHPEYYECVNHPMDFAMIKKKMRNSQYKKRSDFSHDIELILNNCEYYNEDDSPVGQAGHDLRTFFQTQWAKQFT